MKYLLFLLFIASAAAQSITSTGGGGGGASSNDFKENVRVATTANITIATALNNGDTIDGVTLATGNRVLVKDQSTPSQNGIYTVSASPARASDSNTWAKIAGSLVAVGSEGTTNKNKIYLNDSAPTGTLGSTSLSYIEKAASGVGSGDALVANPLSQFAATTSNQLLTTLNDETGTGLSVFGTSPTFTTSLLTGSTTFSLFNSTATTLNFGGAATTLNIGSSAATILNFGGSTTAAQFRFLEPSGSGTNYTGFKAQAQAGNVTYTLPAADGTSGQVLSTNGTGTLSWATASGGLTGSTGGDGVLDSGKAALFDSNGYLRGEAVQADNGLYAGELSTTTGILYLYSSAHAFEATIIPNSGLTADVGVFTPAAAGTLATEEWVTAQGYGSGGTLTAGYIGYGSAGNALTGEAAFTYDATTNTATVENLGATSVNAASLTFEGATADAFETSVAVVDPTADRTFTIPNASGTAILSASNVAQAVDLGGDTSFELPNGAAPTVDAFGELAGDNNLWATGRGAPIFYDGTASTALVNVLVSDTPTNGQVPVWNTGGTITWEANGSGSVATDTIFDAKGDLAVGTGANTSAKLTAGTNGYVLTADSAEATGLKWAAAGSGSSPTTTRGDLIRRGASADERLAVGSLGQVFMTDGTDPQWRGRNKYIDIFDEFMWGSVTAAANSGFGFASSGTISLASSIEQGRPGVALIQAGTGTTDNARLNTGAASIALGGGAFRFETSIKTPAALSDATDEYDIRIGLGDAVGAYTDGVYFEYDRNSSTNWVCGAAKAGATTENAGGAPVAVAADTWYKLKILVNADASEVLYYINDVLIYTNSASNIPNTTSNLCGFYFIIVKSAGTTTKSFSVDYAEAQFDLTTAR